MNTRTIITTAAVSAALALGSLAGTVFAQDEVEPVDEAKPDKSVTGTFDKQTTEDGRVVYVLTTDEGVIELSYGPSWFVGSLDDLIGTDVTIGGNLRDGMPNENASDTAMENAASKLKILTINGEKRAKGKPPWAGGPKNEELGEMHPGFEGWSKGQEAKAAAQANKLSKPEKAVRPDKPGKPVPRKGSSE